MNICKRNLKKKESKFFKFLIVVVVVVYIIKMTNISTKNKESKYIYI